MSDENPAGEPAREDDQFATRVRVTPEQVDDLLRRGEFDFGDRPHISPNPDGTGNLDLFLTRSQVEGLRAEGLAVEVGANLSARARERLAEVVVGDPFDGGRLAPRGLGRKIGGRPKGGGPIAGDDANRPR